MWAGPWAARPVHDDLSCAVGRAGPTWAWDSTANESSRGMTGAACRHSPLYTPSSAASPRPLHSLLNSSKTLNRGVALKPWSPHLILGAPLLLKAWIKNCTPFTC